MPSASFSVGNGGWCRYEEGGRQPIHVRFAEVDGRLSLTELYLGPTAISAQVLRSIPVGRLEAWANEADLAASIRAKLLVPAPDLAAAVSYYGTSFGGQADDTAWPVRMLRSQLPGDRHYQSVPKVGAAGADAPVPRVGASAGRLRPPAARPYPDAFYRQVAAAYGRLAGQVHNPTATIAERSGVPLSAAQRWVRVAREKQFLPPPQHGKRG